MSESNQATMKNYPYEVKMPESNQVTVQRQL